MLLLVGLLVFAAAALAAEALVAPARERRAALRTALAVDGTRAERGDAAPFRDRVVEPVARRLASLVLRVAPRTTSERVAERLTAAGWATTPTRFLAAKGALAAAGVLVGLMFGSSTGAGLALVMIAALGFGGYRLPDFRLSSRAAKRAAAVRAQLPDALDLLAVSVEAGLGFDAAAARLTEHLDGPLIDELALALKEMRMGRGRHDALRAVGERVDVPELVAFSRAVVQADQLGLSLSRVLKVQADDVRRRRQAAAEERAMKAPIKMLFPTVIFIFPAMFAVVLGPALLQFSKVF